MRNKTVPIFQVKKHSAGIIILQIHRSLFLKTKMKSMQLLLQLETKLKPIVKTLRFPICCDRFFAQEKPEILLKQVLLYWMVCL